MWWGLGLSPSLPDSELVTLCPHLSCVQRRAIPKGVRASGERVRNSLLDGDLKDTHRLGSWVECARLNPETEELGPYIPHHLSPNPSPDIPVAPSCPQGEGWVAPQGLDHSGGTGRWGEEPQGSPSAMLPSPELSRHMRKT